MSKGARSLGNTGEDLVCTYLLQRGYEVIGRNFKRRGGEIDIIAKDGGTLVFCEVKTRRSMRNGTPAEAVNFTKQQRMLLCAKRYLYEKNLFDQNVRFDVAEVLINGETQINYIENAFWETSIE